MLRGPELGRLLPCCWAGLLLLSVASVVAQPLGGSGASPLEAEIRIRFCDGDESCFEALKGQSGVTASLLPRPDRDVAALLVSYALGRYDDEILRSAIDDVIVLSGLRVNGQRYAGTCVDRQVFVVFNGGFVEAFPLRGTLAFLGTLHHELVSAIIEFLPLSREQWQGCHGGSFVYEHDNGAAAVRDGKASLRGDPELRADGFVNEYAAMSYQNDVAELWALLAVRPKLADRWCRASPVLECKRRSLLPAWGKAITSVSAGSDSEGTRAVERYLCSLTARDRDEASAANVDSVLSEDLPRHPEDLFAALDCAR